MAEIQRHRYEGTPGSDTEWRQAALSQLVWEIAAQDTIPAQSTVEGYVVFAGVRDPDGQYSLIAVTGGDLQPPAHLIDEAMRVLGGLKDEGD